MALSHNELTAITRRYIRPKLVNNFFESHPLWLKLNQSCRVNRNGGAGTGSAPSTATFDINAPIIHAQNPSGGSYKGDDLLQTATGQKWTSAGFFWKFYYENKVITETDRLRQGAEGIIKIQTAEEMSCLESLKKRLAEGVYGDGTGNDYKDLDGLKGTTGAVGAGTYGGIAIADVPTWRAAGASTGVDTTATITLDLINNMQLLTTHDNSSADLMMTTKAIYRAVWNLIQPSQRQTNATLAAAGFKNIEVNGVPLVFDDYCTASYLYVLNTKYFELYIHPDNDFTSEPWQKPINQNVNVSKLWFGGNLTCNSRRHQGVFTSITG